MILHPYPLANLPLIAVCSRGWILRSSWERGFRSTWSLSLRKIPACPRQRCCCRKGSRCMHCHGLRALRWTLIGSKQLRTKCRPLSGIIMSTALLKFRLKTSNVNSLNTGKMDQQWPGHWFSDGKRPNPKGHVGSDTKPVFFPKFSQVLLWEQDQAFSMKSVILACQKWQKWDALLSRKDYNVPWPKKWVFFS